MQIRHVLARNRWFVLGLLFLCINGYAVGLYRSWLKNGRDLRTELAAPKDGRVSGGDEVRWRFSGDMVTPLVTGAWSAVGPVRFYPDVRGNFCWTRPRELTFRPEAEWKPCTDFKAAFSDELRGADFRPLADRKVFDLHSDSLTLRGISQADFSDAQGLRLLLEFSADVSPDQLRESLSITNAAGQAVGCTVWHAGNSRTMTVNVPQSALTDLNLYLRAGLQSTAGPRGLERDVAYRIRPARDLRVLNVAPETHPFGPNSILVSFNRPVAMESVGEFVKVEPPLALSVEAGGRYHWRAENQFRIAGDFKPGRTYTVTLRKGLPGKGGEGLERDITQTAYLPDADPSLEITATGHYLSPRGAMVIPFRTIGISRCRVTLRRVYPNNLVYLANRKANREDGDCWRGCPADGLSRDVIEKEIAVDKAPNEPAEHRLSLREFIGGSRGAFYVSISGADERGRRESRHHVVVSDTGLSLRKSDREILVWANSIRTLEPVSGASVKVFSAENQELAAAATDADGLARFPLEDCSEAGSPFLVTAQKGEDITYLTLADSEVDVKGGVGDRPFLDDGYEAYVFADRGIYRPGEIAHLKAIVRGKQMACPAPFPVQLNVYRPDNKLDRSLNALLTRYGTAEFDVAWPDFAATGTYGLDLTLPGDGPSLGSTRVAVEEFVPPQIRVDVRTPPERGVGGDEIPLEVRADYLFGRPASGLQAEAFAEFLPQPVAFPDFADYEFGDPTKRFVSVQQQAGRKMLNDRGSAEFSLSTSEEWRPPAAIKAVVMGTVLEIGGRGVTASAECLIDVYPCYIGLKRGSGDFQAGRAHTFEAVVVDPEGVVDPTVARLNLTVEKLSWATVLKKNPNGVYTYVSEPQVSRVLTNSVTMSGGQTSLPFTPPSGGDYRLSLQDPLSGASSSLEFHAGVPGQQWATRSMEAPDAVELTLDKERYLAGETATLVIRAPFAGKALVTLESTQVLSHQVVALDRNTAEVKFPVRAEYAPNVYCAVTVIRAATSEELWGPHRAAGLKALAVDVPARKTRMTLSVPGTIRPRQKLAVEVQLADAGTPGGVSELVLAAVDEGICSLTGLESPDPYGFFMAPRRPESKLHDLYSLLIPELSATIGGEASSPGGDKLAGLSKRLNPIRARRFNPVALWSSTVMTDTNGRARVQFDVPEFTGQLRLMAVAVDEQRFASAQARVAVVRPLVVQSSLPRFLAPEDRFSMPVQIRNETGQAGEALVHVECTGPLACADGSNAVLACIAMDTGTETNVTFRLAAQPAPGLATCRLEVDLAGEHFAEDVELAVRPRAGRLTVTGIGRVGAGKEETLGLPVRWLEKTGRTDVWLSPLAAVELGGSLNYLLNYPYGCLEQTTSKSFPLLYLFDLAEQTHPGSMDRREVSNLVQAGIHRILSMQRDDGSFSLWPGGEPYPWGSMYATHFLVEAGKAGHRLPEERVKSACDYVEKWMAQPTDPEAGPGDGDQSYNRAYACYVLALAGRPQHSWMSRLGEQEAALPHDARVNLAAAWTAAGRRREGSRLLGNAAIARAPAQDRQTGGSLRSNVRDDAMLLTTWMDLDPENAAIPGLVRRIESSRVQGRWYTTQENAVALLALGKYCSRLAKERRPLSGRLAWNGAWTSGFAATNEYHAVFDKPSGGSVTIRNEGGGPIYYYWKSEGIPADGQVPEEDHGLKVRRELLDLSGRAPAADPLRQGELAVVQVTLETDGSEVDNVVVEDLLPAGLEIENANLKTSQAVTWCRERQTLHLLHTDARDDRLVAFTGRFSGKQTYFYAVRAVTPGEFVRPALLATCMYDPGIRSASGAGRIRVEK